jgi:uncharacterized membrane protein
MKRSVWKCLAAGAMLCGAAGPALAWVKVCNKTPGAATVAFAQGEKDGAGVSTGGHRGVTVEGWWRLAPGECAVVSTVNARAHWLYVHAHHRGRTWGGAARLCVRTASFEDPQQFLMGGRSCKPTRTSDWREAGFARTDATARNHTMNLT